MNTQHNWNPEYQQSNQVPVSCFAWNKGRTGVVPVTGVKPWRGMLGSGTQWVRAETGRGNEIHVAECFSTFERAKSELLLHLAGRRDALVRQTQATQRKIDKLKNAEPKA